MSAMNEQADIDWREIEDIFTLTKEREILAFFREILNVLKKQSINNEPKIAIELILTSDDKNLSLYGQEVIKYIKASVLKKMEVDGVINKLIINKNKSTAFFMCKTFKIEEELQNLAKLYGQKLNAKNKNKNKIEWTGKSFKYAGKEIVFERSQRALIQTLWDKRKILSSDFCIQKGKSIHRKDLEIYVGYKNEKSFRTALERLRGILKQNNLPIKIEGEKQNHFIMIIDPCPQWH